MLQLVVLIVDMARDLVTFGMLTWWVFQLNLYVKKQIALKLQRSLLKLALVGVGSAFLFSLSFYEASRNAVALAFMPLPESPAALYQLLWIIFLNDFAIRFVTIGLKALLTALHFDLSPACVSGHSLGAGSDEDGSPRVRSSLEFLKQLAACSGYAPMSPSAFRRRRQLVALIEMISMQYRMMVTIMPWCQYYRHIQFGESGPLYTGVYLCFKFGATSAHLKSTCKLLQLFVTQDGRHGPCVDAMSLAEAGESDCPICCERFVRPIRLPCEHVFCEECVNEWLERERTCPLCRVEVPTAGGSPFHSE